MLSKVRFFSEVFGRFEPRRAFDRCYGGFFSKCFHNVGESDELPDWIKRTKGSPCVVDDQDVFVVPSNSNWVCDSRVRDKNFGVRYRSCGVVDIDSDVDRIGRILKSMFVSPEAVVLALEGCKLSASTTLVDKMLKRFSNDWIPAFGFFKWVEMQIHYKHEADAYDSMVDILGKSKQFDVMWELVGQMVQVGGLVSLRTMSKIMRRLAGAGRWEEAIMTLREVEKYGLSKDTLSMNLLLDTLCKERCVEHAQDAFVEFKNEIPPNHHTFNVLIHGWCKARKLEKAWSIMEEMERYGFCPCVISYTSLVEAYCHEKDFRKVDSILNEMQEKGCPPNVVTYTIVMHSLGKAKETYEALEIYEKMKRNGCIPDTSFYNSLIYILSKAGRLQDAHKIYEEMSRSGSNPNVMTYNTMISAACQHLQDKNALILLQEMEERLCKPDLKTYAPLLKMCCRNKWIKILYYLMNDMFKNDISLDLSTYSLIVHGLCKSDQLDQACLFFEEMVLRGLCPRSSTFNMLENGLERKNMEEAKRRIEKLMAKAKSIEQPGCHSRSRVEL